MSVTTSTPLIKHPEVKVKLTGEDGNAFAIMGAVSAALRKHKISAEEIKEFMNECMSGDYNHLLATCCAWVDVS